MRWASRGASSGRPIAFPARLPSARRQRPRAGPLAVASLAGVLEACGGRPAPPPPAHRPPVVVLGWDGADPRVVEDLLAAGLMPNLRALRERGSHGRLRSHAPYLSPLLWTSVATGVRPGEHG